VGDAILGPIDYLAVEWPGGHVTGEGFGLLLDLVERETIRVLDLAGASSGLLDQSDIDQVAAAIAPKSLAGILVYENVPMWTALDRSSARLVGAGRIVTDDLIVALDATEPS